MPSISMVLVCDGSSDRSIKDIVDWFMLAEFEEVPYRLVVAQEVVPAHGPLQPRLARAASLYASDLLLCHRDGESAGLNVRTEEIRNAAQGLTVPVIPVVPVRMMEAWLLSDGRAIRCAADNRNGSTDLGLPSLKSLEGLQNPKQVLFDALRAASGLSPQRLKKFNKEHARSRVAGFVQDFSPLRVLPAYCAFEVKLRAEISKLAVQFAQGSR